VRNCHNVINVYSNDVFVVFETTWLAWWPLETKHLDQPDKGEIQDLTLFVLDVRAKQHQNSSTHEVHTQ
jgi:hypothetical protein